LFEDNAEFGLGLRLAVDKLQQEALELLPQFKNVLGDELVKAIADGAHANDEATIAAQRERIFLLKNKLQNNTDARAKQLLQIAEYLIPRSVWTIGGDGWAYDIGYGGLDHVLSCGKRMNILVLDTEVYSNTGGQSSKATPRGAMAKFAANGKSTARKDLGVMAMTYGNIYIAQISIGANPVQALRAIKEAEAFPGTSLILAYSTCIAHGYEMIKGIEQQKLAVASGFWPLYRYNPQRREQGLNPLQLDSAAPSIPVRQYAYNEPRFKALVGGHPEHAEELMKELQGDVDSRWQSLTKMAQEETKATEEKKS
jgi:pyruvate-ferredoxin/flavodoxin oxidoreductase